MTRLRRAMLALAAVSLTAAAPAEDWGDQVEAGAKPTESQLICRRVKGRAVSAADVADARRAAPGLKGCDAEALYYGIGMKADPVKARQCAILNSAAGGGAADSHFDGEELLMVIYANGSGAPRDIDLAIHLACGLDAAPAEHDGRVASLAALKSRPGKTPFHYCQDITSGYAMGVCAAHEQRFAEVKRKAELARITARYTPPQKQAFAALETAAQAYAEARAGNEIDLSGTGRGAFALEEEAARWTAFQTLLGQLAVGRLPAATAAQNQAADAKLNAAYRKLMAAGEPEFGTVTLKGVRDTERVWIRYRDAWLAFAKAAYPATPPAALSAHLTRERTALLEALLSER